MSESIVSKAAIISALVMLPAISTVDALEKNHSPDAKIQPANIVSSSASHEYAVELARNKETASSLEIFQSLIEMPNVSFAIWCDYATVLVWDGKYQSATNVYETKLLPSGNPIPDYVKLNIAKAYYELGDFISVNELCSQLSQPDNLDAKLLYAQYLAKKGNIEQAELIYNELLKNRPDDFNIYLYRAKLYILRKNNLAAANDIETAINLISQGQDIESAARERQLRDLRAEMGSEFIRATEYNFAIYLLKPLMINDTAPLRVQSDYIFALYSNGEYQFAIEEATRLWPDYTKIPLYGRQAFADSYMRLKQPQKALPIYQSFLQENNLPLSAKRDLAYAYAMTKKDSYKPCLALYKEILESEDSTAYETVVSDAVWLMGDGYFEASKKIFELVFEIQPDNHWARKIYAENLAENNMPREASAQYKLLPKTEISASAGLIDAGLDIGDYRTARKAADLLRENYPNNTEAAHAIKRYEHRTLNELNSDYLSQDDYKGKGLRQVEISYEKRLDDRFSILGGVGRKHIYDNDDSMTINMKSIGLRYVDMNKTITYRVHSYSGDSSLNSYQLDTQYFFGDRLILGLGVNRMPIEERSAIAGGIMATGYNVSLSRRVGLKDTYTVSYNGASISDGNTLKGYSFDWNHTITDIPTKFVDFYAYFSRSKYSNQEIDDMPTLYESPETRESFGIGLRKRWIYSKHYWEGALTMDWGRDRPEPIDFSPYVRIEYGYNFSRTRSLVLGSEFGMRTDRLNYSSTKLLYGYRNFFINYNVRW